MRKRGRRKPDKPPPAVPSLSLQYKVVELSTVDEKSIEQTVNEWVGRGWTLENLQFAMRESSKRPAMAFVFFTRQAAAPSPNERAAKDKLVRLAEPPGEHQELRAADAFERLAQLAGEDTSE